LSEAFQPIAVRAPSESRWLFALRCLLDLQLLTVWRFLKCRLPSWTGRVLDVGAGEAPWRELLTNSEYVGVDVASACEFGMRPKAGVVYYDGSVLPFADCSFDHVLCTEVIEHVPDPCAFVADLYRVLRPGGSLALTAPWSARLHHLPHDYHRFTRYGLRALLEGAGFATMDIAERGNDVAVIANKLLVLLVRLLWPQRRLALLWTPFLVLLLAPAVGFFLVAAHFTLVFGIGSREDPLGYNVVAWRQAGVPRFSVDNAD
jgi:SAM-dependent methyltransferase